jgi:hypothetical protein
MPARAGRRAARRGKGVFMTAQQEPQTKATEPHGAAETEPQAPEPQIDWKAEARKWEQRAKENSAARKELDEIKRERMTETERMAAEAKDATARAEAAEAELERMRADAKRASDAAEVAAEFGVPANLLTQPDREAMVEQAKAIREYAGGVPAAPVFGRDGAKPATKHRKTPKDEFDEWFDSQI